MYLQALKLRNFRAFKGDLTIPFTDLTTFIGKNDVGKSSILDALAIFFESPLVKFESSDICIYAQGSEFRIGCVFSDLPNEIVLDATAKTNLSDEFLLNEDGDLEIHKIFNYSSSNIKKPKIIAIAHHPTTDNVKELILQKNTDLKAKANEQNISNDVSRRSNVELRKALWANESNLNLATIEIPLEKDDAKKIWEQINKEMPIFALFRSDRPSTDEDSEVQDPMKLAVKQAIQEMESSLEDAKNLIKKRALTVAELTVKKLKDFDESLAEQLNPTFLKDPKWENIFKLSLTDEEQIPINKRGSGVRRLILLSFFRAEAERQKSEFEKGNILYAIEEPETSQHPVNQKLIIEAFQELSEQDGHQIVLTTHVPALAGLLPMESIRYVTKGENKDRKIEICRNDTDNVLSKIADELGILPDKRVRVLICVEGPNDVSFLKNMNKLILQEEPDLPNLSEDPRIVVIPLGGSTLKDWVNNHYLKNFGLPEIHIYDQDINSQYKSEAEKINERNDGSHGFITQKREFENYLHPKAVLEVLKTDIEITDDCDVEKLVKNCLEQKRYKGRPIKRWLNDDVVKKMTVDMLSERGGAEEIIEWFSQISKIIN